MYRPLFCCWWSHQGLNLGPPDYACENHKQFLVLSNQDKIVDCGMQLYYTTFIIF